MISLVVVSARDHCICWNTVARLLPSSRNLHNPRTCLATCPILTPALPSTRKPRARFYGRFARLSDVLYSSSAGLKSRSPSDGRLSRCSLSLPSPLLLSIVIIPPFCFAPSHENSLLTFSALYSVSTTGVFVWLLALVLWTYLCWLACSYSGFSPAPGWLLSLVSCLTTTVAWSSLTC